MRKVNITIFGGIFKILRSSYFIFVVFFLEFKAIQAHKKSLPQSKRQGFGDVSNGVPGTVPKMPMKRILHSGSRVPGTSEPEPVLPSQIRLKYKIGKIIGDGNFAVVRRCSDR